MARIQGICKCSLPDCDCSTKINEDWVDVVTEQCRDCEINHGDRWGHHGTKAEQPSQDAGEHIL